MAGSLQHDVGDTLPGDVSPAEARAAADAVCASACLARSERLQKLLRFICDTTIRGDGESIKEAVVAAEVFGRTDNYDPHEDSTVRRQAHALRQKLKQYYETEGRADAVHIDLPVGRYVPVFRRCAGVPEVAAPPAPAASPGRLWAGVALAVAAFLAGYLLRTPRELLTPAQTELWGPWLASAEGPTVCLTNRPDALVKHFGNPPPRGFAPPEDRAAPADAARFREFFKFPGSDEVYLTPSMAQMKVGEAIGAVQIANLLGRAGIPLRTVEARYMNWEVVRKQDIILLGEIEANPWIADLLAGLPVRFEGATSSQLRRIVNTKPRQGESSEYVSQDEPSRTASLTYALVSSVPGLQPGRNALSVAGLTSRATQVAVEYITSPDTAKSLVILLRQADPRHRGPWHFQLVLEASLREKVPTRTSVKLVRVLPAGARQN